MNNEKLANLLYPNVKYTEQQLETIYPQRNIDGEITRIAPSPTGFLHVGTAYGALLDKLTAKSNGVFYMRLEDTDKKREVDLSGKIAYDMLCALNLEPTEGYRGNQEPIGLYGPYIQSERLEIYKTYAKKLVFEGKAFPCFCEKAEDIAEIEQRRQDQLDECETIEEKDPCRNLTYEQIEEKIKAGKPFALRYKNESTGEKTFKIFDLIKGEREIRENAKDFVLIKSNQIPVYAFAHAVDDHLMRTSIVIRGEEWYASLAAHIALFDALGFEKVKYAHTPVLCKNDENGNKRKLSKRKDPEADTRYYITKGFPVEALYEYLLNLANSDFEPWRLKNPTAPISEFNFSIEKVGSNNPMFDLVKLTDVSKTFISKLTAQQVYERVLNWAENFDEKFANYLRGNKEIAVRVFNIDRESPKPRKDIDCWANTTSILGYMFKPYFQNSQISNYELENVNVENAKLVCAKYLEIYKQFEDKQQWFEQIKDLTNSLGFTTDSKLCRANPEKYKGTTADVCLYIRLALTGRKNSPDLYEISCILGEEEVKSRLKQFVNLI